MSPEVVAQRVGRADVAIRLSVYAHVRREDDQRAAELAAGALLGRAADT